MRATVLETGAFEAFVFKCALEAAFEVSEYVRSTAETGAFEVVVFKRAFELAFEVFTCVRALHKCAWGAGRSILKHTLLRMYVCVYAVVCDCIYVWACMCVTLCVCMWRDDSYMQFSMSSAKWNGILDFWVLFLQITQYACVQKDTPVPVYACACMQKPTMWPRRDRVVLVCPEQYVTPVTKIDQNIQKTRARHAHAKCFVLDHPVSRLKKICKHAQTCQHFRVLTTHMMLMRQERRVEQ